MEAESEQYLQIRIIHTAPYSTVARRGRRPEWTLKSVKAIFIIVLLSSADLIVAESPRGESLHVYDGIFQSAGEFLFPRGQTLSLFIPCAIERFENGMFH